MSTKNQERQREKKLSPAVASKGTNRGGGGASDRPAKNGHGEYH